MDLKTSSKTGTSFIISQDHKYNNNASAYPIASGDLQSDGLYIKTGSRLLFFI